MNNCRLARVDVVADLDGAVEDLAVQLADAGVLCGEVLRE
jgi:hypothetical protein